MNHDEVMWLVKGTTGAFKTDGPLKYLANNNNQGIMGFEFKKTNDDEQRYQECKIILKKNIAASKTEPQVKKLWKGIVSILFKTNEEFKELIH